MLAQKVSEVFLHGNRAHAGKIITRLTAAYVNVAHATEAAVLAVAAVAVLSCDSENCFKLLRESLQLMRWHEQRLPDSQAAAEESFPTVAVVNVTVTAASGTVAVANARGHEWNGRS